MLNPTPFIQSTFNTVGAQIALLRGLHCYNTTYANRWTSFENALTDAALRIGAGLSRAVLVGAFDDDTVGRKGTATPRGGTAGRLGRIVGILRADRRSVRHLGRGDHGDPVPGRHSHRGKRRQ